MIKCFFVIILLACQVEKKQTPSFNKQNETTKSEIPKSEIPKDTTQNEITKTQIVKADYHSLLPQGYQINSKDITELQLTGRDISWKTDAVTEQKCSNWNPNQKQIKEAFIGATVINGSEWHYSYNHYPCEIRGTVIIKNIQFDYYLNAGASIILTNPNTQIYLGCQNKPFFIDRRHDMRADELEREKLERENSKTKK